MPAARARSRSTGRDAARRPSPRSDAYTGLLILSLLALTVALVFAYLNWSEFPDKSPPKVTAGSPPAAGAPAAGGAPANPPAVPPVQPPGKDKAG